MSLLDIAKECKDVDDFIKSIPMYTGNEIDLISSLTKDQSKSDLWKAARRGRITASRYKINQYLPNFKFIIQLEI